MKKENTCPIPEVTTEQVLNGVGLLVHIYLLHSGGGKGQHWQIRSPRYRAVGS